MSQPDPFEDVIKPFADAANEAEEYRKKWPSHVKGMDWDGIGRLGIDDGNRLYWDGNPVEVRRRLDLSRGERWFAVIVGAFTIAGSVGAVAQGWAAAHQWSCTAGYFTKGCPLSGALTQPK